MLDLSKENMVQTCPGNPGHCEKTNPKNYRNRGRQRKYFQQIIEGNFPCVNKKTPIKL